MKGKMPLSYISYSAWALYKRDPMEYYQQYYVGRVDEPTLKMRLGKIFQEAWCDPKYNYAKELEKVGFTFDYERVMRTALGSKNLLRVPKKCTEKKVRVKGLGLKHPILAIFDGIVEGAPIIIENKYGHPWSRKSVIESIQLQWYSLAYYIKHGKMPRIILQSVNSKNGTVCRYEIKHSRLAIDTLVKEINNVVESIKAGNF